MIYYKRCLNHATPPSNINLWLPLFLDCHLLGLVYIIVLGLVLLNHQTIFSFSNILFQLELCRVLTPYYTEEVLFSLRELESPNEDGVSILFYLQKIFPGVHP